jgi:hypothetical protein
MKISRALWPFRNQGVVLKQEWPLLSDFSQSFLIVKLQRWKQSISMLLSEKRTVRLLKIFFWVASTPFQFVHQRLFRPLFCIELPPVPGQLFKKDVRLYFKNMESLSEPRHVATVITISCTAEANLKC